MRLVFCLAIVALSAYIGRQLSRRAMQRLDFFRAYEAAVTQLSDKVVGMSLELSMALAGLEGPLRPFFVECSQTLEEEPRKSFSEIWNKSLDISAEDYSCLTKEDMKILRSGGEALETLCINPSERQSSGYLKRVWAHIEHLEAEKRRKSKLYGTAGLLGGLFMALLMI